MKYSLGEHTPQVADSAFLAPDAVVVGDVEIGDNSSVWFGSVLRGDVDSIRVGDRTNVQDQSVIHGHMGKPVTLGDRVTVGHAVQLHGCTLESDVLVGIGSTVLNGVHVGEGAMIAAGSLVVPGTEVPENTLFMGSPAKAVRTLEEDDHRVIRGTSDRYVERARRYRNEFRPLS